MSIYEAYESGYSGESPLQEWEVVGEQSYEGTQGESEYESELELELAQELLEVSNEAELEQFLGDLVKGAGKFLQSGVGKAVTGVLKNVAKTALPMVGSALGSMVLPGVGTAIGGKLGSMASKMFEAGEAEMLGEAEAEVEAARRFVRFGRATSRYASTAPSNVPPNTVARSAAISAARRYAPGLLQSDAPSWRSRRASRWADGPRSSGSRRPSRSRRPDTAWVGGWPDPYASTAPWSTDDAPDVFAADRDDDRSSGFEFE